MSLVITLEERLYERSLTCEPGYEKIDNESIQTYNNCVEFSKYKVAIIDVLKGKYHVYKPFERIIDQEWKANKQWHRLRLLQLLQDKSVGLINIPYYMMQINVDYASIIQQLELLETTHHLAGLHLL